MKKSKVASKVAHYLVKILNLFHSHSIFSFRIFNETAL